jgi:hypothetical protein
MKILPKGDRSVKQGARLHNKEQTAEAALWMLLEYLEPEDRASG